MAEVRFRKAAMADVPEVVAIYENAKGFMRRSGNMTQWVNGYPGRDDVLRDIERGVLYVGETPRAGLVCVFAFIPGVDPTYDVIDGRWLNDEPYATIHRIASSGRCPGIVEACTDFCLSMTDNIRIDTHRDNRPMIRALEHRGYSRCGVIICADGTPREAYHLSAG